MQIKSAKYFLATVLLAGVFAGCVGAKNSQQNATASVKTAQSNCEMPAQNLVEDLMKTCANVDGTMYVSGERFSINVGCNQMFGELEFLSENSLALRRVASTKKFCDDEANAREFAFSRALATSEIFEYERQGNEIILRQNDYSLRLGFTRE